MKNKTVALGGTFDILHKGHKALFKKAFSLGEVVLGLTSDDYAKRKKRRINSFIERKKNIEKLARNFKGKISIVKIEDKFGETLKKDFDYIVVSKESLSTAREINKKRKNIGKKPIKIVEIPLVLDKAGRPFSSTRIFFSYSKLIKELKSKANNKNKEGMVRFGINPKGTLGISVVFLRALAKQIKKDHELALKLWKSGIHEARLLAVFIAEPEKLTEKQMESWVLDIDSWDICDQVCSCVFGRIPFAERKIYEWTKRKEEFVKRAGFVLMAVFAVQKKEAKDSFFEKYFSIIKREVSDDRNFVKKAVNWALRQIGKRNEKLRKKAIKTAEEISRIDSKSAKWIASNALSELRN